MIQESMKSEKGLMTLDVVLPGSKTETLPFIQNPPEKERGGNSNPICFPALPH